MILIFNSISNVSRRKRLIASVEKFQDLDLDLLVILQYLETNSICQSWISMPFSTESWVLNQGQHSI